MAMDYQTAFDLVTAVLLLTTSGSLGYILIQFRREFDRQDKRIDEVKRSVATVNQLLAESLEALRATNEQAHKELRCDQTECQRRLPQEFIPRAEYNTAVLGFRTDVADIKAAIIRIEDRMSRRD